MHRLWQTCAGPTVCRRLLNALAAVVAVAAAATLAAAAGAATVDDSGARLVRVLPHYAAPALAAGWIAAALAAFHLRSLARTTGFIGVGIRTAAHLCAPPTLWLSAMHAGAWLEWQVRRTPIAYGTDWFYAEMYHEYVREPAGLVLSLSVAVAVTAPLAAVLAAWIACICGSHRQTGGREAAPRRGRPSNRKVGIDQS